MIRLDDRQQAAVDAHLASPVVEVQLRVESWRGTQKLGELACGAGRVRWDETDLRGLLDVDVQVDRMGALSPAHPVGPYGQVLRAFWRWPQIGIEVPVGWWRVSMPERRDRLWWQVQADPEGMARLRSARWQEPPHTLVQGSASAQIGRMVAEAGVAWIPTQTWSDWGLADTECRIDDTVLSSLDDVLVQVGGRMWPARDSGAVLVGRPRQGETPDWTVTAGQFKGSVDGDRFGNRITVWYEVPGIDGAPPTYITHTEPLKGGPRAYDGPLGRVDLPSHKLDASVTAAELRGIARQRLREAQLASASLSVTVPRADPRREVGDLFRAVSLTDEIDCLCRCVGIELDVSTGAQTIEGAVITGTVNGVSASFTDLGL